MGVGYLKVDVHTGDDALPVKNAHVTIKTPSGEILYDTYTNDNGFTETYPLSAPDAEHTLDPNYGKPAYSVCDVDVSAEGFVTKHIHDVEIVDTQTAILPVNLKPLADEPGAITDEDITIPPIGLLLPPHQYNKVSIPDIPARVLTEVIIPDYITVHLGIPTNAAARNVRVKFTDYIKNVASSEIYSTWPNNSLMANITAIITFALNRVFTEWYRARNFNFDITNSTAYDQSYRDGGPVFENISQIVDSYFNVYAHRLGFLNPFFTQFCDGKTVSCNGLSQWGTVSLANQGRTVLEILRYYYPNDLQLTTSQNIVGIAESYPGYALRLGSQGDPVMRIQNFLNRIRVDYPLIPLISNPNGTFGTDTEQAVRTFQRAFNITVDGVVGRATWNRISFIYVSIIKLAELNSEGIRIGIGEAPPNVVLSQGSTGANVVELQFLLNIISAYFPEVPSVIKDSVFGASVKNAVIEFQKAFGLTADGVVGISTWNKLYAVYRGIGDNAAPPVVTPPPPTAMPPFPGTSLGVGSTGPNVRLIQTNLNVIRTVYPSIPSLVVDGSFGQATKNAVIAFQREFVLTPDGIVGPITWNKIMEMFNLVTGSASVSLVYPGTPLRVGSTGSSVRLMQQFLNELRKPYPSLPAITADGIFGPQTAAAVRAFQTLFGLTPDGIIGPITWYEIINQRNEAV